MTVFECVHLHCIKKCIVRHVIFRIGTGHHPGKISDDIAIHLERGARLLRLFAEPGDFFPLLYSANLRSLQVLPDRSASLYVLSIMRSKLVCGGGSGARFRASKVRFTFTGSIFSSGGGCFLAFAFQRSPSLGLHISSCFPPRSSLMVTSLES